MRPVDRVVLATTATTPGGVWRHLRDLGDGLLRRDIRVGVALDPSATALAEEARQRGFAVARFAAASPGTVWHLHLPDTFSRRALASMLAARLRAGAVALTEHLPRSEASDAALADRPPRFGARSAKTAFKKVQFALADRVIAVSAGSRDFLLARYGLARDKVTVVANGIAPVSRVEAEVRPGPARVVAVGSVIRQKGFDVLLAAVRASHGDWVAEIMGDGPHRADLTRRAAEPGIAGRIRFRGWASDVESVLARADVAVMPSRWESAPYAALEAMTAGLPVVASRVDGLSEIVVDGGTGLLVPPDDPVALARAVDTLASDRSLARRLGAEGRRRVAEHYGVESMVDRTVEVYRDALGARS